VVSSPYRDATLLPPAVPPLWQHVAAWLAPNLFGAGDWQWYRRMVGGRWCRVRLYSEHTGNLRRIEGEMWAQIYCCPRPVTIGRHQYWGLWFTSGPPLVPIGWDVEAIHDVDPDGRCTCEVYP